MNIAAFLMLDALTARRNTLAEQFARAEADGDEEAMARIAVREMANDEEMEKWEEKLYGRALV